MNITTDIETVPTEDPAVIEAIAKEITPPGNMSKADTIAAWELDKKPGLIDEAVKKTSFDGGLGRIICIGYAVGDDEPNVTYGDDEAALLREYFSAVQQAAKLAYHGGSANNPPLFIGHNIGGFDLRFMWQRAVVHKIRPPACIPFTAKPWDKTIADTMVMWNPEREKRTSLDKLCRILKVPTSKGDMDGSMVWDYYKAGRITEIAEYCKGDVRAARECYRRMTFMEAA